MRPLNDPLAPLPDVLIRHVGQPDSARYVCMQKKRYKSEIEAMLFLRAHGLLRRQEPYRCRECGRWHARTHPAMKPGRNKS